MKIGSGTGAGTPEPTDPNKYWDWLARQPLDVQQQYRSQYPDPKKFDEQVNAVRQEAYNRGENLPGVTAAGSGMGLDPNARAKAGAAANVGIAQQNEALISSDPRDYAVDPSLAIDQGPGYQLTDKFQYADPNALPAFDAAVQDQAINQERTDTTGVDAQKGVLGEYANLYKQGGLNAIDRARIEQSRRMRAAQGAAQEGAIMQSAEQMGRAGSNASILARLQAQQGVTDARSMDDLQTQALGLQRRDALLRDQGTLGGQVQTAQDAIDQFNTAGERDRAQNNLQREQAVREAKFGEGSLRERENAAGQRAGATTQFVTDADRSAGNTERGVGIAKFNVGPNQGARGMAQDRIGASQITAGHRMANAGLLMGQQQAADEAEAAAVDRWLNVGKTSAQIGTKFATAGMA